MESRTSAIEQGSTHVLRVAVLGVGAIVLGLCVFALPIGIATENLGGYRLILAGLYVPAIPFFIALYQAMKLLKLIDHNKAFSDTSVVILNKIKECALVICGLFTVGLPYVYVVAERDDAPGVLLLDLVIIFASFVIAGFAAVLAKLLHNAKEIKSENDLTV